MIDSWTFICCPECSGEGVLLSVGAPGVYSAVDDAFSPSEMLEACDRCGGDGVVEACAACGEPFGESALIGIEGAPGCSCARQVPHAA